MRQLLKPSLATIVILAINGTASAGMMSLPRTDDSASNPPAAGVPAVANPAKIQAGDQPGTDQPRLEEVKSRVYNSGGGSRGYSSPRSSSWGSPKPAPSGGGWGYSPKPAPSGGGWGGGGSYNGANRQTPVTPAPKPNRPSRANPAPAPVSQAGNGTKAPSQPTTPRGGSANQAAGGNASGRVRSPLVRGKDLGTVTDSKTTPGGYFSRVKSKTVDTLSGGYKRTSIHNKDGSSSQVIRDSHGKVIGASKIGANGKPTMELTQHADGRGSSINHYAADGTKTNVSTRLSPSGRKLSTTTVSRPDGSREITHPNGTRDVEQFGKVDGHTVRLTSNRTMPDGTNVSKHYAQIGGRNVEVSSTTTFRDGSTMTSTRTETNYGYNVTVVRSGYASVTYNYHSYSYGGVGMYVYAPVYAPYYYNSYFYSWGGPVAYPVSYWGWGSWYGGYYSNWFSPYPIYGSPSLWITDFLIADMLQTRYENSVMVNQQVQQQQEQEVQQLQQQVQQLSDQDSQDQQQLQQDQAQIQQDQATQNKLTSDMKDQVSSQVAAAMQAYKANQPLTVDNVLTPVSADERKHIFAVHDDVDATPMVYNADSDTFTPTGDDKCTLSNGDLIQINKNYKPAAGDESAMMDVITTAGDESCSPGSVVAIPTSVLQDMLNAFAQRVEKGMTNMSTDPHMKAVNPPPQK